MITLVLKKARMNSTRFGKKIGKKVIQIILIVGTITQRKLRMATLLNGASGKSLKKVTTLWEKNGAKYTISNMTIGNEKPPNTQTT